MITSTCIALLFGSETVKQFGSEVKQFGSETVWKRNRALTGFRIIYSYVAKYSLPGQFFVLDT